LLSDSIIEIGYYLVYKLLRATSDIDLDNKDIIFVIKFPIASNLSPRFSPPSFGIAVRYIFLLFTLPIPFRTRAY